MTFNPTLHGIRGLAAMLVLVYHWQGTFPALANAYKAVPFLGSEWDLFMFSSMGWIGVDWFFVMSGYVLAATIWNKPLGWKPILQFWKRRLLRIYPAIWLQLFVLLLFLAAVGLLGEFSWSRTVGNAVLWLRPLPGGVHPYNSVTWTLVMELSFYLVLPFLVIAYRQVGIWPVIAFVLALQLVARFDAMPLLGMGQWQAAIDRVSLLFPGLQLVFVLGMSLNHWPQVDSEKHRGMVLLVFVALYFMLLWAMGLYRGEVSRWHWSVFAWRLLMVIVIAGIVWSMLRPMAVTAWLAWRPLVWLGEVSYGLYLWHFPVQRLMPKLFPDTLSTPMWSFGALLISIAVTLVLASASYYWLERPLLRRFAHPRRQAVSH